MPNVCHTGGGVLGLRAEVGRPAEVSVRLEEEVVPHCHEVGDGRLGSGDELEERLSEVV